MTSRIDYDTVAPTYDQQPYRSKEPDPKLVAFARTLEGDLDVLDVACGTGNQIVASQTVLPDARFVGVDASAGMLTVARDKAPDVTWIQSGAESLPLDDDAYDYASCQFAYHHFHDLEKAVGELRRVVRPRGMFVLSNVSPHDYRDSLFYRVFPTAWERDREDFRPSEELEEILRDAGFDRLSVQRERVDEGKTLGEMLEYVSTRENNSHLSAMDDEAYAKGLARLKALIADRGADAPAENPVVIVRIVAGSLWPGAAV